MESLIIDDMASEYTRDPIPVLNEPNYTLRNLPTVGQIWVRTEKFESSFYTNSLLELNKFDPEIRESPFVSVFKKKLGSQIRPPQNSVYGIHNPKGVLH